MFANRKRIILIKCFTFYYLVPLVIVSSSSLSLALVGDESSEQATTRQDRASLPILKNFTQLQGGANPPRAPPSHRAPSSAPATAANQLLAVRQHWRQMEKSLGHSFESLGDKLKLQLKDILATTTSSTGNSSVSSGCKLALAEVADKVRDGSLWASQMLDASAKLPSGLLDGTLTELGNFDGCLAIRSASVQGQYCAISIKPHLMARPRLHTACQRLPSLSASSPLPAADHQSQTRNVSLFRWMSQNSHQFYYAGLRLGICTPQKCTRNDLQLLLNSFLAKYELIGQVKSCQLAHLSSASTGRIDYFYQHFDFGQRIIIFALLALVGLSLIGTLLECLHSPKEEASKQTTVFQLHQQQPRRWQYQVSQRGKCSECTHSALADNLALWTGSGRQTKEDPLLSCPTTTTRKVELDFCLDEEQDESWIVKLEQNQRQQQQQQRQPSDDARETNHLILLQVLRCFSLRQNLKTICRQVPSTSVKTNESESDDSKARGAIQMEDIKVIHGLRTLTMIWIIFGHTIGLVNPEMMNNLFALAQLSCSSRFLQALLNATLAVNTFFVISGVVTMISLVRRCQSSARLAISDKREQELNGKRRHSHSYKGSSTSRADADCEEDSISIASSGQSSGVSSNRRCIHSNNNNKTSGKLDTTSATAMERKQQTTFGFPNDFKPFLWLLMRYLRLTPAYATVIGLSILMPSLGDGPFWLETAGQLGAACKQNWHLNLAYLNNLLETDKLCLIHSWYLSNDWQFFLLTLMLLGLAYKSKKLALLLAISLAFASMAVTFAVTVLNEYPPTIVTTSPAIAERWQFIHQLYYKPWPHLNSYLVGLLVGYSILTRSLHNNERQPPSGRWRLFCVGLLVACLASFLLSSIHPWNMGHRVDPILTGLHSATFRTLWATCCGWLLFTLALRPQLLLAKFLSWPGFQLTSRLTYCTYLIHPLVIYYHFGTLRERIDSSMYAQLSRFLATLALSYLMALLLSLLVESPSIQLQRLLASRSSLSGQRVESSSSRLERRAKRRHLESLSSGSGTESAATTSTTHSWLVGSPPAPVDHCSKVAPTKQDLSCQSLPPTAADSLEQQQQQQQPSSTALDAEFQQKLAQAIGRGFRIRSRMAAAKSPPARSTACRTAKRPAASILGPAGMQQHSQVEPTSMGLIQNPLQKLQLGPTSVRRMQSAESLGTFQPALATTGLQQLPVAAGPLKSMDQQLVGRRSSADEIAKLVAFDKSTKSLVDNGPTTNNCSLNDLIQMRRKFMSQRSHSSNVHM